MEIQAVLNNFRNRGYSAVYFETAAEAKEYLMRECAGKSVTFGGSMTLEGMGLYDELKPICKEVNWHWKGDGYHQTPDIYLTSANAVSEKGEIVNIDGTGNRIAATVFGVAEVLFVCGINKLTPDLSSAIERAQNIASPKNALRLTGQPGWQVPACAQTGGEKCFHCKPPASICRAMVIHQGPMMRQKRCELVLIGEELGY